MRASKTPDSRFGTRACALSLLLFAPLVGCSADAVDLGGAGSAPDASSSADGGSDAGAPEDVGADAGVPADGAVDGGLDGGPADSGSGELPIYPLRVRSPRFALQSRCLPTSVTVSAGGGRPRYALLVERSALPTGARLHDADSQWAEPWAWLDVGPDTARFELLFQVFDRDNIVASALVRRLETRGPVLMPVAYGTALHLVDLCGVEPARQLEAEVSSYARSGRWLAYVVTNAEGGFVARVDLLGSSAAESLSRLPAGMVIDTLEVTASGMVSFLGRAGSNRQLGYFPPPSSETRGGIGVVEANGFRTARESEVVAYREGADGWRVQSGDQASLLRGTGEVWPVAGNLVAVQMTNDVELRSPGNVVETRIENFRVDDVSSDGRFLSYVRDDGLLEIYSVYRLARFVSSAGLGRVVAADGLVSGPNGMGYAPSTLGLLTWVGEDAGHVAFGLLSGDSAPETPSFAADAPVMLVRTPNGLAIRSLYPDATVHRTTLLGPRETSATIHSSGRIAVAHSDYTVRVMDLRERRDIFSPSTADGAWLSPYGLGGILALGGNVTGRFNYVPGRESIEVTSMHGAGVGVP